MPWRGGGGGGENQPALSEVNPPADATALSFSPPPTSPAESGSFPACLPPAYSGTSRMIPDPLAHSHCLPLCFICSWNPWLPTSSLQAARPFGEQPTLPGFPSAGLGSCVLALRLLLGPLANLASAYLTCLGWPLATWPLSQGACLLLPRVQESRLYPIHLVLIPDSRARGPPLPSSPRPTLLITVSFRPSPSLQTFALTPWTSQSSSEPLGSWFQPH